MSLRRINYHCGCGSCDECTGGNAKSYFEGMTQVPNIEQIVPIPGPAGEGSVLTAGKTSSVGVLNADGADEALDSTAKANLAAADFDIEVKSTTQNVVDTSDLNNNKIWTGLSKGFLNMIGLKILPARVKTGGTAGQVYTKSSGTDYDAAWAAQTGEIYNSVTTTSLAFNETTPSLIDDEVPFTVGNGYSYRFKNVVAIVDTVAPLSNYIEGIVVSYAAGVLTVKIKNIKGSGNTNNYNVMLTAPEYLPFIKDPANYGKFFYNNSGVIEMRSSLESVGDTKIWFSATAPDTSWWLCDGTPKTIAESPGLYNLLVTQNNGVLSPFYVSATTFNLPNATGAAFVGVKASGVDSITLGEIKGTNQYVLVGNNLPEVCPYPIVMGGQQGVPNTASTIPASDTPAINTIYAAADFFDVTATMGNNIGDGGTAIDMRQQSLGVFLFIKAV